MSPNRAARIAAVILALAGLASLVAGGLVATHEFRVTVPGGQVKCGSVLFPKDPRNRVSTRATVPQRLQRAYKLCQKTSSDRTHTATTFLLVGVVPLLIVLMLPALSRRSRRSRAHRRQKF
jgi:hypothetical protein